MTKTKEYIVTVPAEGPAIPAGFSFYKYETTNGSRWRNHETIDSAACDWFEYCRGLGTLTVYLESEPVEDGGTYVIYSEWNESAEDWGPWMNDASGKPIDLKEVQEELKVTK
jgi:hypothetical protein